MLHWIKKQSSGGHVLEKLESSDTKIMMKEPVVCQLYKQRNRKTETKILEDTFQRIFKA